MMKRISKSNGFGSWKKQIVFAVSQDKAKILHCLDWEHVRDEDGQTIFRFYFTGGYRGDDELAMFTLGHSLPPSVEIDDWTVLWDESVY